MTSAPYVFISHSSKDNDLARRLHHDLAAAGLTSWLDVHNMRDGGRWVTQIQTAVEDCAAVVLVHTRASRTSEWVQREILFALEHNKPIFIARCEDTPLPLELITRQFTDFTTYALGLKRLIEDIRTLLHAPPLLNAVLSDDLTDEERFFLYIKQLPHGSLATLVARDLYVWANHWADDLVFKGLYAPSLYVQQQVGMRLVSLFAIRGYLQRPCVEIAFDHLLRYAPSLYLHLDAYQERLSLLQIHPQETRTTQNPRRPNILLISLDTAEKLEMLKALIDEIRDHLVDEAS